MSYFLESDYLERDPYRKLTVGLSHAFGGALLVMAGLPLWFVMIVYVAKEVAFDIRRVNLGAGKLKVIADSIVDSVFWYLGAAMVAYSASLYGFAALGVGAAYFIAGKLFDDK